jgi:hypothetical protein
MVSICEFGVPPGIHKAIRCSGYDYRPASLAGSKERHPHTSLFLLSTPHTDESSVVLAWNTLSYRYRGR